MNLSFFNSTVATSAKRYEIAELIGDKVVDKAESTERNPVMNRKPFIEFLFASSTYLAFILISLTGFSSLFTPIWAVIVDRWQGFRLTETPRGTVCLLTIFDATLCAKEEFPTCSTDTFVAVIGRVITSSPPRNFAVHVTENSFCVPDQTGEFQYLFSASETTKTDTFLSSRYEDAVPGTVIGCGSVYVVRDEQSPTDGAFALAQQARVFSLTLPRTIVHPALVDCTALMSKRVSAVGTVQGKVFSLASRAFSTTRSSVYDWEAAVNAGAIPQPIYVSTLSVLWYNAVRHGASSLSRTLCLEQPNGPSSRTAARIMSETHFPVKNFFQEVS